MRNVCAILAVVVMLASGSTPNVLAVDFFDNFDNYTVGDDIVDQDPGRLPGGWAGWDGFFVAGAPISDAVSFSGANSVLISGDNGTDLVHEFAGITSGRWEISAMQYIPAASTGNTFFIMMSEYTMGGDPKTWAAQLEANMDTETLTSTIITGTSVPLVLDDWAEIKIDADLDQHTADVYYNGTLIGSGAWNGGIQAVDLYPTATATTIYYDDFTLAQYPELTWDDAQSGNWNSANWTGGPPSVPDDRTYALINAAGRTVTVAADAQTRALSVQGGTLSINTGRTLSVATTAEFAPDTLLNIAAGGQLSVGATPSGNPGAIDLTSGGRLSVPSTMAMPASLDLRGGTFEITGELALVDDALSHYGFHINDDALAMDLHWNGGMMGNNDPTSFDNFYAHVPLTNGPGGRGLDFNDDNDFINSGAIGQNDNYSNLWVGYLHVDAASAGDWEFRNAGDDDAAGIWLDLDKDGEFYSDSLGLFTDNGEQLSWEDGGAKARTLTEGDYLIAFTHREGGGGSRADFTFKSPSMGAEARVKPGDPAQAGLWSSYGELPVAFSKALDIAVHEDSGLVINAIGGATLGSLTLNNGALSVTGDVTFSSTTAPAGATSAGVGGDGSVMGGDLTIASNAFTLLVPGSGTVTYDSISIPGTATALTLDVDATMTPVVITANGGSPAVTITKAGASTLTMAEPNVNLENASWAVSGGTLDVDVTTADPLAGAPVTLAGGTLRISTTAYDPNSMVPNVVDYAFYDNVVNTELAAIDDGIDNNQNGGLLNLEPTSTQKWTGEIWQQGNMSDTYHQVWSGLFTAPKTGTYEFYVHGDDYEMLWIDKNGDGEFDNTQENEAVTANPHTDGWNTPKTGTIDLVAGQSYDFALGHNEGGGGDFLNATIKIPDGAAVRMNPSDPAQAGWWATRGGTVAISVTSTITVDNPVAVGGSNTVKLAFYDNVASSELAAIDDGVDNGLNGGLLLLDPTSTEAWDGAIWQGANFSDTYHKVWSGSFTAPETGTYTFNVHGDDYEMFWIDKNRDGEFDGAEETVTSNPHDDPDGWNTPRTGTIELVAGQSYDFALGLNEVGGNDFLNATIQTPTGSAVRMNPSDPAQDGWWSAPIEYGTSTLDINTETASTIDQIILKQGGLAIAGAPVTVGQASISTDTIGIVGLITHTPTVLTGTAGLQGNDQTVVLTKSGAADLVLNRAGVGLDNATIAVNGGSLVSQAAAGANPLGGAALALNGGTFVASATSAATSPVTYGNAISVDSDSALSAAAGTGGHAGPMTVNVTGPVTLDAQLNLSAGDNYELNFLSPVTGDGGLLIQDGTVAVSGAGVTLSSLEVAGGTASLIGENLTVGAMTLSGGVASTAVAGVRITGSMEIPGTGTISAMAGDFSVIGSDLAAGTGTVQLNGNVLFEGPASGTARFIRVWKNVSGLLHIGEIEAFVNGEVPDGAGSGGLSANDMALGTLGASHYINVATPDVSTTTNLQHGDPVRVYNALIETGANTWSTNNVQGMYVLDLGQAQPLSQIRVWQRGDCCEVRLENFTVSVLADDGGAPGEVLWSESYPGQAPRPGFAEFSFPTIAMEASAAEVNHLTGAGTVDGLIDVLGTIGPGVGGIGTITVGNAELGIDSGATFIAEVSVAAEVGDADKIVLAGGDSALMLGGELNVSSANDRTANDFFSAHATRTIVSNPIGSGGSIGWFDNVTDPQNPVMVGNRFDTVNPPLAAPGEPSPHIGEGAFLQGVDYVIPFGNITSSVELDVFIALGGDADGDGKVWLSDWAALRANFGNTGTGKTWTEGNFDPWADDKVWLSDWAALRANFGNASYVPAAGAAAVPEPGTIVMLLGALAGLALFGWRRRRAA